LLVRNGKFRDGIEMCAKDCGLIAAKVLIAAQRASDAAGLEAYPNGSYLSGVAAISASRTELAPGPMPGELSLIFHHGQARMGIRLELARARELATALLAATEPEVQPDAMAIRAPSIGSPFIDVVGAKVR
jgi:hypothetical protein